MRFYLTQTASSITDELAENGGTDKVCIQVMYVMF